MGRPRSSTCWGGIPLNLVLWNFNTIIPEPCVTHAFPSFCQIRYCIEQSTLCPSFCCLLNWVTNVRWQERMQRRPWIIVGQSGRWRRPTPTCSSPSSTGWRRRRPRGRSTWWDEAGPRNHPLSIGFEGCNRYDAHLLPLKLFIWCLSAIQTKTSSSSDTIITDHQDDDPCLVSTMTESLLPFLPGDPFTLIVTWIVEYWGDIVFLNSNWIFPRTKWHWCKAAVITTTGHPGPLSLAASCNLFKPWRWFW